GHKAARTNDDQPRSEGLVVVVALDVDDVAQGRGQLPPVAEIIDDQSTGADDVEPLTLIVESHGLEPHRDAELDRLNVDVELAEAVAAGPEQQQQQRASIEASHRPTLPWSSPRVSSTP